MSTTDQAIRIVAHVSHIYLPKHHDLHVLLQLWTPLNLIMKIKKGGGTNGKGK